MGLLQTFQPIQLPFKEDVNAALASWTHCRENVSVVPKPLMHFLAGERIRETPCMFRSAVGCLSSAASNVAWEYGPCMTARGRLAVYVSYPPS